MLAGRIVMGPGGGALDELHGLLRGLVAHPNTAPFISRQLIQKTITSSPTPGFVHRVATVFNNNGKGVRGDLPAVYRAMLLDPEARGARKIDWEYGRLREPVLFWTAMIRALDVTTDGNAPHAITGFESSQSLFKAPSIFNYYAADNTLVGTNVPGPEFGIFTSTEYLNRVNQINGLLFNSEMSNRGWFSPQPVTAPVGTPSPALTDFLKDAASPDKLVDRLARLFLHGAMPSDLRKTMVNAVGKIDAGDGLLRVKMALNIILASTDYQVQR
jgi:hypothetical protein